MARKNKKIFKFYLSLPSEMRRVIIDEMHPVDRCIFTRCSKLSSREARESKNFIYGLEFDTSEEDCLSIKVIFDDREICWFRIVFQEKNGKKKMSMIDCEIELWKIKLDSSINLIELAANHFKNLLEIYQTKIKWLRWVDWFFDDEWKDFDFGIHKLNNLQGLELRNGMDLREFFPKLRKPLKHLYVVDIPFCQEICEVERYLILGDLALKNDEFRRLTAYSVEMHLGYLTEMDIHNFIQSWQTGTLGRKVGTYTWKIPNTPDFDKEKLFRLLGIHADQQGDELWNVTFLIDHDDPDRFGILEYMDGSEDDEDNEMEEDDDEDEEGEEDCYRLIFSVKE